MLLTTAMLMLCVPAQTNDGLSEKDVAGLTDKLYGKVSYDRKAKELTIKYEFGRNPKGVGDFASDIRPKINRGHMILDTGMVASHPVKWAAVSVTGSFACDRMRGVLMRTPSGDVDFSCGGANPDTLYLGTKGNPSSSVIAPPKARTGKFTVQLEIHPNRVVGTYAQSRVAVKGTGKPPGSIDFHGGELAWGWSTITFKGKVDKEWLAAFLKD